MDPPLKITVLLFIAISVVNQDTMNASKSLKETHPQKYYLKLMCKFIYFMGMGDCWYEKTKRSKTHKVLYGIWAFIINAYVILTTINGVLANFRSDLLVKERNDLIQFSFAHPSFCLKYIILIFQKERVRVLLERMLEGTRSIYSSVEIDRASMKSAFIYVSSMVVSTFGTLLFATIDGIWTHIKEGIPIRTEVVLYPTRSDSGVFVNILRVMVELHWWCIVTYMLLVNALSTFSLTFTGYKFKLVRRCAQNMQYAIGNIYSIQVIETTALMVMTLVRLVASMVGTSIFHSGWDMVPVSKSLRCMVVVSIQRSQVPVYMSAFGIIMLSHANFVTLMRSSYSFFAVMY
ncbi:unnamed protein product [Diatraea saccharalis]|uniref:Odorant receptor n=1 Tax=Diatraea saccharalis TaxID=40085 RepID=A0A9P0C5C2_9NEOP|nr:unnamed protein product [Diatraea saccharalis]